MSRMSHLSEPNTPNLFPHKGLHLSRRLGATSANGTPFPQETLPLGKVIPKRVVVFPTQRHILQAEDQTSQGT